MPQRCYECKNVHNSTSPCKNVNVSTNNNTKVRFVACLCDGCIHDRDDKEQLYFGGGPCLEDLCTKCSVEHLEYLGRYHSARLQTRLTNDHHLDTKDKKAAELALKNLLASRGQDEEATVVDTEPRYNLI